jgi:hypothetical protein
MSPIINHMDWRKTRGTALPDPPKESIVAD